MNVCGDEEERVAVEDDCAAAELSFCMLYGGIGIDIDVVAA